ncbi:MAG: phosphopantothenoylcysteine synthase [Methylacidiphilales bacterium]|nr:phosphopantothenoylcysteine synthase [Candidatus Methylacidiphilales bacterium]
MRIIITSGPSYEPLDKVRRLSNFSTGELGTMLAEGFANAGHMVICFRGTASTFAAPLWPVEVIPFTTNDDLEEGLQRLPFREEVNIVFHAAALCDFRVGAVVNEKGEPVPRGKMPSRDGKLTVTLEPAPKLIASLRRLFPTSLLVGWKYEIEGTANEVRARGRQQIEECLTDACVLNGQAYGPGFGIMTRSGEQTHLPDKKALCRFLIDWADRMPINPPKPGQESFHPLATFMPLSPFI